VLLFGTQMMAWTSGGNVALAPIALQYRCAAAAMAHRAGNRACRVPACAAVCTAKALCMLHAA
jgi:hypothetical protein